MSILTHPALLTALVSGLILFQVHRHNAYRSAADKFYSTVLKEFDGLYPTPGKWPNMLLPILREKSSRLEIAVTEFRRHLGPINRRRLDAAWNKYQADYYEYEPRTGKSFDKDGNITEIHDTTNTYKDTFRHNVDALLKFAKQI